MLFQRGTHGGTPMGVLVVQVGCRLEGDAILPLAKQPPIAVTDAVRGEPRDSSITTPNALATYKPNTDITVDAVAYAPGGVEHTQWPVHARVGDKSVDLMIRGPHEWTHGADGWTCSEPRPTTSVPVIYEKAFGGSFDLEERIEDPRNPLGTGFLPPGAPTDQPVPAPQIVAADEPPHEAGEQYPPRGLGAIAPDFAPRRDLIGTTDEAWLENVWPRPPQDFDYASYQHAHPDLVYDGYLRGDEPVELRGLLPGGEDLITTLPGFALRGRMALVNGTQRPLPMALDTVHFSMTGAERHEHRIYLVWRALVSLAGGAHALAFNTHWLD